ncbi:cannabinoid receptor 1-like [Argopecten irradians]|uniref:cannabinoid receptor 1-like n=1 Tax=Argopecten irradians TaxID=31199 RepID=UPI003715F9E9
MDESDSSLWNITMDNSTETVSEFIEVKIIQLTIVFVMTSFVTASNVLVLVILIWKSDIKKNYRIEFILWQCLSDIVVGISGWMFGLNYIIKDLSTNANYCRLMYHFIAAGIGQSIAHTFLICIDRYMAIVKNIRYKRFTKKYRYMVIFGTWLFIHCYVGTLVVIGMRAESISYCALESFPTYKVLMNGANLLFMPLFLFVPCIYIYSMVIFRKRLKQTQHCSDVPLYVVRNPTSTSSPTASKRQQTLSQKYEQYVIVTIGLIVMALLVFTGPFVSVLFLEGMDILPINRGVRMASTIMTLVNSTFNPFLYVWRIRKFRQVFKRMLCPCTSPRAT